MQRLALSWRAIRGPRGQTGQTLIIMAFLSVFLLTLLGLVVDSVRLYILSAQAERAAEAAALAGVLYMPQYFSESSPAPDGESAQARACAVLQQNGITACLVSPGQIGGQILTVPTSPYQLQVTVTLQADVFFLAFVSPSLSTSTVSRSAIAEFLPPIELGSRDPYFGDQSAQDAVNGTPLQYFWAYINGPAELQEHGDAYSPTWQEGPTDPQLYPDASSYSAYYFNRWSPSCCTTDHQQWSGGYITNPDQQPAGFTGADGHLGYNYELAIPPGAPLMGVQLYNPAFDPTDSATNPTSDGLDSACFDPAYGNGSGSCATTDNPNEYLQLSYSLYAVPMPFERALDSLLTSVSYPSLDLYSADLTRHGCTAGQAYNPVAQTCVTKPSYVDGWTALPDQTGTTPITLGPGIYRLVVESSGTYGRHGYGIKLTEAATGQLAQSASGYGVWGWNNMCVRFTVPGTTAVFDLGEIPAAYAGTTLNFNLFDPGDASGDVYLEILDPSGNPVQLPSWVRTVAGSNGTELLASNNGDGFYNGLWLHLPIPIPATYHPTPGNDWWTIKYIATQTPADTITINISLSGSPIHLVE